MLPLIDLTVLEAGEGVAEGVGRHAHLQEHLRPVPGEPLAADDARAGLERGLDEPLHALGLQRHVVVEEEEVIGAGGPARQLQSLVGRGPKPDVGVEAH